MVPSERFVIKMVRACLPHTTTHITFWYGTPFTQIGHEICGSRACSGSMCLRLQDVEPLINVSYSLLGLGDGTWTSGQCTISLGTGPDESWEFYCKLQDDGVLQVTTMVVMRRRKALRKLLNDLLTQLGNNSRRVSLQLGLLGYSASLEGLSRYLGEILALEVRIAEAITDQGTQYTISGIRLDDPELSICEDNLPRPVREFIADQLVLRAA